MKHVFIFFLSSCLIAFSANAQTKKIAYESHSGNPEYFVSTLDDGLFDNGDSDFGLPASKSKYKIDSVIYVNDTTTVLIYKEYTGFFSAKNDSDFRFQGKR